MLLLGVLQQAYEDPRVEAQILCTLVFIESAMAMIAENNPAFVDRLLRHSKQALVAGAART